MAWSHDRALIKMPYEFRPLPQKRQIVLALNREGEAVAEAEVIQVHNSKNMNKVPIVSIAVDKQFVKIVRNIRLDKTPETGIAGRCNDLDLDEIRAFIAQGYTTIPELKQMARLGMGPCQGRNCLPIVINELSKALNIPVAQLSTGSFRPMVKSIKLGDLAAYNEGGEI